MYNYIEQNIKKIFDKKYFHILELYFDNNKHLYHFIRL